MEFLTRTDTDGSLATVLLILFLLALMHGSHLLNFIDPLPLCHWFSMELVHFAVPYGDGPKAILTIFG